MQMQTARLDYRAAGWLCQAHDGCSGMPIVAILVDRIYVPACLDAVMELANPESTEQVEEATGDPEM